MSHSHINQLIHVIWSTQGQLFLISQSVRNELYAYISTLVKAKDGKVFACGGTSDHIHILLLLPADISLSTLISHVKAYSSKWIKSRQGIDSNFSWQKGYLAVSIQRDRVDNVCRYIQLDENRHNSSRMSYIDELKSMLKKQDIPFNEQYFLENSHSKILLHTVWSTHNRSPDLDKDMRSELYAKIETAIINCQGEMHAIGGVEDHVHVFVEAPKNKSLSDLMREVKTAATHWLKNSSSKYQHFEWQAGYGAFSISSSSVEDVKYYIQNQEEHHRLRSYAEEWNEFLLLNGV